MTIAELSEIFLVRLPDYEQADLERRLRDVMDSAQREWPGVEVEPAMFIAYLADRLPEEEQPGWLDSVRHSELYVACGCALGDRAALRAFEDRYFVAARYALSKIKNDQEFIEEGLQRLRSRFFAGEEQPKIAEYMGQGSLEGWVRTSAARIGMNMRRGVKREVAVEDFERVMAAGADPTIDILKAKYRPLFREAFTEAIARLTVNERNLLRLNVIERVSIDQLATLEGVHRSSVARWLASCRKKLGELTRENLRAKLDIAPAELDSIIRLVRSHIDVSLHRHLAANVGNQNDA